MCLKFFFRFSVIRPIKCVDTRVYCYSVFSRIVFCWKIDIICRDRKRVARCKAMVFVFLRVFKEFSAIAQFKFRSLYHHQSSISHIFAPLHWKFSIYLFIGSALLCIEIINLKIIGKKNVPSSCFNSLENFHALFISFFFVINVQIRRLNSISSRDKIFKQKSKSLVYFYLFCWFFLFCFNYFCLFL